MHCGSHLAVGRRISHELVSRQGPICESQTGADLHQGSADPTVQLALGFDGIIPHLEMQDMVCMLPLCKLGIDVSVYLLSYLGT